MHFVAHNCWIVLSALVCASLTSIVARSHADFEIESFNRYRIIRIDNNNNGYVDRVDITDPVDEVENRTIADAIDKPSASGSFDYSIYNSSNAPSPIYGSQGNAIGVDFGDLHTFNVTFESLKGFSYLQGRGVQLEKVIRFSPEIPEEEPKSDEPKSEAPKPNEPQTTWEVFYGVRFYQFDDSFTFEGNGGILGRTWAQTSVENQHGGPHLGVHWNLRHDGWTFAVSGLAQSGLGATDSRQSGQSGEDLNPGSINSPIFYRPRVVGYQIEDQFNTIYSEIRAQVKRELSELITVTIGCSGYYFGDIKYAGQSVNWSLPSIGVVDGTEDSTVTTAFASLEFRH